MYQKESIRYFIDVGCNVAWIIAAISFAILFACILPAILKTVREHKDKKYRMLDSRVIELEQRLKQLEEKRPVCNDGSQKEQSSERVSNDAGCVDQNKMKRNATMSVRIRKNSVDIEHNCIPKD